MVTLLQNGAPVVPLFNREFAPVRTLLYRLVNADSLFRHGMPDCRLGVIDGGQGLEGRSFVEQTLLLLAVLPLGFLDGNPL